MLNILNVSVVSFNKAAFSPHDVELCDADEVFL